MSQDDGWKRKWSHMWRLQVEYDPHDDSLLISFEESKCKNTRTDTFVVVHGEGSSPSQISCVTWEDDRHISIVSCKDQRGLGIYSAKTSEHIHMDMIYQYIYIFMIYHISMIYPCLLVWYHTFCDFLVGRVSTEWGKLVTSLKHLGWVRPRWRMPYFQLLGWPWMMELAGRLRGWVDGTGSNMEDVCITMYHLGFFAKRG